MHLAVNMWALGISVDYREAPGSAQILLIYSAAGIVAGSQHRLGPRANDSRGVWRDFRIFGAFLAAYCDPGRKLAAVLRTIG